MTVSLLISNWTRIRSKLVETIDCFDEQDLDFRPADGHWTVRELMLHIAEEEKGEVSYGVIQELGEWPGSYDPADYPTIASIKALLSDVHSRTQAYLQTITSKDLKQTVHAPWDEHYVLGDMLGHVVEHEVHHRGELSLILGLLGREAPDA